MINYSLLKEHHSNSYFVWCFFIFMQTIYKYPVNASSIFTLEMPENAKILCVQTQNNQPCIWALVNTELPNTKRIFEVYATGEKCNIEHQIYIGTFQLNNGSLVFHLFEFILPF